MGAPPFTRVDLRRLRRDELVEKSPLAVPLAKDSAQPLHVFADRTAPGKDDGDVRIGDIDPFVQHLRGDDRTERPQGEVAKDLASFAHLRLVRNAREEHLTRDGVGGGVILGKEDRRSLRWFSMRCAR